MPQERQNNHIQSVMAQKWTGAKLIGPKMSVQKRICLLPWM